MNASLMFVFSGNFFIETGLLRLLKFSCTHVVEKTRVKIVFKSPVENYLTL